MLSVSPSCRSAAVSNLTLPTATETVTTVRFNLSEASVLASIGSDRSFTLYDIRTGKAERRIIMQVCFMFVIRMGMQALRAAVSLPFPQKTDALGTPPRVRCIVLSGVVRGILSLAALSVLRRTARNLSSIDTAVLHRELDAYNIAH